MKIEVWHKKHECKEVIKTIPQIGSIITFDENSEFEKVSKAIRKKGYYNEAYKVVKIHYWLNNKGHDDEVAVIVKDIKMKS